MAVRAGAGGEDGEPLVRNYGDSFEDTDLESVLAEQGVGRLLVTGARTDEASELRTARSSAGYDTT